MNLATYSSTQVLIRFINKIGFNNRIFIDNINVDHAAVGVTDIDNETMSFFYDVNTELLHISCQSNCYEGFSITVYNSLGAIAEVAESIMNEANTISFKKFVNGLYFVEVNFDNRRFSKKIVK